MSRHYGLKVRQRRQLIRARNRLPFWVGLFAVGVVAGLILVELMT